MNKRGIVFTLDMIIGIVLVVIMLLMIPIKFESTFPEKSNEKLGYNSEDVINALSLLKASDIRNKPTISSLLQSGVLKENDMDKNVLDLIGSFWYSGNQSVAENITREVLGSITDFCFNLTTDGDSIYSSCNTTPSTVAVREKVVSGYQVGQFPTGYISRATATEVVKNSSSFTYFGGFEGQGNITKKLDISNLGTILEAYMELNSGGAFELYVNGNYSGNYTPSYGNMTADRWVVCNVTYNPSLCSNFHEGSNQINFDFVANDSYIAGGYFKVTYNSTAFSLTQNDSAYQFPGIDGVINVFSSFYVPGNLNSMGVFLRYTSNYTAFLTLGNSTVWEGSSGGVETSIWIPSDQILGNLTRDGLSYSNFSRNTVPIRMGIRNISDILVNATPTKVVISTDVSGSMGTGNKLAEAKAADKEMVETLLDYSNNLVGLNNYSTAIKAVEALTNNETHLNASIDSYAQSGNTCMCCGINAGIFSILNNRTGWKRADNGTLSGTYSQSGGGFSDTRDKDNRYWYFGSPSSDYNITANATLNFTISDLGINASNVTSLRFFVNYCHDGSSNTPAECDGDSAEGNPNGAQDLFAYNFSSSRWVDIGDIRTDDNGFTVTSNYSFPGNATDFIEPSTGRISVRTEADYSNGASEDSWFVLDYAALNVSFDYEKNDTLEFIVIMSDGQANVMCGEQGTGNPDQDAINAACFAKNAHNITVHAVGFGTNADNATMQALADCGGGQYYYASVGNLVKIFRSIAEDILNAAFSAQLLVLGQAGNTMLHPDSYIYLNHTPDTTLRIGELAIYRESDRFEGNVSSPKNGWFIVPNNTRPTDARVTSYSSFFWTDRLKSNGATVYNLSAYMGNRTNYTEFGDPYIVHVPISTIVTGNNSVSVDTASAPQNTTGGSPDSKVLFTIAINASVGYGAVFDNQTDAVNDAIARLNDSVKDFADIIDFDVDMTPLDLGGVPSLWGPSLFKIVTWPRTSGT